MTYTKVWRLLKCTPVESAKIFPHLTQRVLEAGEKVFRLGDEARFLYIIHEGRLQLDGGSDVKEVSGGFLGEECGLGLVNHHYGATAAARTSLTTIPREVIARLVEKNPTLRASLYSSLLQRLTGKEPARTPPEARESTHAQVSLWKPAGWLLTIVLSALVFFARPYLGLDFNSILFLTVFTAAIVMWVFNLVDEFIPGLFAIAILLVLDVAPPSVTLSGFGSDEFFMILSVSALGAIIETSGLAYRSILTLLKRTPPSQFWCNLLVLIAGTGISAVIPSANGRVSLGRPMYQDMVDILGYKWGGKAATALASAIFNGMTLFSGLFLTSKTIHFVVYGMLPQQVTEQFGFAYWTVAAAAYGAVMILLYLVIAPIFFRNVEAVSMPKTQFVSQAAILGPLSHREIAAIVGIGVMIVGFITTSMHKIEPPWIALSLLFAFLALNVLTKKEFQQKINWPFLLYLGSLTGMSKVMTYTGLDQWFGSHLGFVIHAMQTNFPLFVLALFLAITITRFFVPNNATVVIFASLFLPMANIAGIHPWVVGFIILCLSDAWMLPYQCTYYLEFRELNAHGALYHERSFLWFNMLTNLFRVAAIYASLAYWKWIGIL